ncbi:hypothetical protein T11_15590 [Trichinella zimbabwensis]|uniref:Uncharacterized protein n=1 Tax=Trichinella zimbabwensis TaxID=268475 RepID=A0A0V1GTH6_9BILA|nr:hypothetical protein T11_15590 [Trichinella zimbabwensis]
MPRRPVLSDILRNISHEVLLNSAIKIREKTGRNRCEAATLLASVITLLLLFSKNAELLCNSICFAYPAVKSLEKLH